jgi:hypothetical protein
MKKILILLLMLTIGVATLKAQGPPPTPPSSANNGNPSNGPVGGTGGAPIGNGTFILLTLAAAYAGRKVYVVKATDTRE